MSVNSYPNIPLDKHDLNDTDYTKDISHYGIVGYTDLYIDDRGPKGLPVNNFHPKYKHHIVKGNRVNAASIEMGIGQEIINIAQFANTYTIGNLENRIGVAYFTSLGSSGIQIENIRIDNTLVCISGVVNHLVINSGFIQGSQGSDRITDIDFQTSITNTTSGYLFGSNYIQGFKQYNSENPDEYEWGWINGLIQCNSFRLFDSNIQMDVNGNASSSILQPITYKENSSVSNVADNIHITGNINTFTPAYIQEDNMVVYDGVNGHDHSGSEWTNSVSKTYKLNDEKEILIDGIIDRILAHDRYLDVDLVITRDDNTGHQTLYSWDGIVKRHLTNFFDNSFIFDMKAAYGVVYIAFVEGSDLIVNGYSIRSNYKQINSKPILKVKGVPNVGFDIFQEGNRLNIQVGNDIVWRNINDTSSLDLDAIRGALILPTGSITSNKSIDMKSQSLSAYVDYQKPWELNNPWQKIDSKIKMSDSEFIMHKQISFSFTESEKPTIAEAPSAIAPSATTFTFANPQQLEFNL